MNRNQSILTALLAFHVIVILLARSPFSSSTGPSSSRLLFPELDAATTTRIQLDGDEDRSLTLERKDGNWVIGELGGYPVDATKIEDLIEKLGSLEVRLPVVSSSRYHKTFELTDDENRGRLRLFGDDSDTPEVDLVLGNSPNYRVMNVRRTGEDEVFEVRGLASYDVGAEPGFWAEKQLVEVPDAELLGIKVTNASGTLELHRQDGSWKIATPAEFAGVALDDSKVDSLVSAARSIRIDKPVGPVDDDAQGFRNAAIIVELSWREDVEGESASQVLTYRIGDKVIDKESQRYVSRAGFGFTGTVWESSISTLLEAGPTDLSADAPTAGDS